MAQKSQVEKDDVSNILAHLRDIGKQNDQNGLRIQEINQMINLNENQTTLKLQQLTQKNLDLQK